ncbi:MAG TPA: hypothetical protein VIJ01_16085, partial [Candidatus Angelobacter sp.]
DEALKQVNKSLKEGTEAAEALNHVLDGDLAGTFKSLGELSKTLGIDLGLAFSPAEIIAFAQVIAEVADKLSKLIADTIIYTDEMKEEDKAQRSLNQRWVDSAARIKAIGREMQITAEKTEAGKDALRLKFQLEDIGGTPEEIKAKIKKVQDDIKQATEDAKETETQEAPGSETMITNLSGKAVEAEASLKGLNVTLSDLQRELRLATAVVAQGAQVLANDLAAAAEKAAQDKKREQDALVAAADKAAKDKKQEQDALDAWVAHAVHSRGTLTEAVKRMAKEQAQADIDANLALAKSEDARIAKINADEQAAAEEEKQRQDEVYRGTIEVAKLASDKKIQLIEQDFERGKINQQQEIAAIAQEKERELEIEKLTQQKRWALWTGDVKKQQEIQNQIDKIKAQSELVGAKAQTDSLRVQEKNLTQFFSKVKSAMDQSISGLLRGTESFSKAWQNMWSDMVVSMVQKLADMMLKWIEHHVAMLVIHTTEKEGEVAADSSAAAESKGISLADAIAKIHHSAAAAASRVYEAEAPLGPVIAGLLAAGTYTAVLGFGAMASAEGGQYYVPNNQLTMLHPQEMVLPAGIANQMRSVIGGGGGGGVTVVVNHSVSAVDAASFQGHIRRHSNMIANEVTRALKRKGVR